MIFGLSQYATGRGAGGVFTEVFMGLQFVTILAWVYFGVASLDLLLYLFIVNVEAYKYNDDGTKYKMHIVYKVLIFIGITIPGAWLLTVYF